MKKYEVLINRTYFTYVELEFPNDGKDHKEIINHQLTEGDPEIWNLIIEKELDQMEITDENWQITELNSTVTGALSKDTGPQN